MKPSISSLLCSKGLVALLASTVIFDHRVDTFRVNCKKGDGWVVLNGRVLNGFIFLIRHPDGELTILKFAGKGATVEFDTAHPPDVVETYVFTSYAIMGVVGSGKAKKSEELRSRPCPLSPMRAMRLRIWRLGRLEDGVFR